MSLNGLTAKVMMPSQTLLLLGPVDILATAVLAFFLVRLVLIDLRDLRLPDHLTLPLVGLGLALSALRTGGWPTEAALGAAVGFTVFWLLGAAYFRLRGVDGLGQGDAKLLAAAGAWLGPQALPWLVLLAALGALSFAIAKGQNRAQLLAFGPWLAAAFWAIWLFRLISPQY